MVIYSNELTSLVLSLDSLQHLDCASNKLTSLDLSHAPRLTILEAGDNQLTSVNLRVNANLDYLGLSNNQLPSLDVSGNPNLTIFNCANNHLAALDLQSKAKLKTLLCDSNSITSLDLSGCPALVELYCNSNQLTALDLRANNLLALFSCKFNLIQRLDFGNRDELYNMDAEGNRLTMLDFSTCPALAALNVSNNQLTRLNMKNIAVTGFTFDARRNPSLSCIDVSDPEAAEAARRADVDPTASFSTDCPRESTTARNTSALAAYPNPTTGKLILKSNKPIGEVKVFDLIHGELKSTHHGNEIDLSHLKSGVYRVHINQDGKISGVRIIKQ